MRRRSKEHAVVCAMMGTLIVMCVQGCGSTYGSKRDHEIPKDPVPPPSVPGVAPSPPPNPEPKPGQPYAKPPR